MTASLAPTDVRALRRRPFLGYLFESLAREVLAHADALADAAARKPA